MPQVYLAGAGCYGISGKIGPNEGAQLFKNTYDLKRFSYGIYGTCKKMASG